MSTSTETAIGNVALQRLGKARVIDFDDASTQARALKANFESVRDTLLASHLWSFALTRTTLEADATDPEFGYSYRYALPGDCLTVVELPDASAVFGLDDYRDAPSALYAIEGRDLMTDLGAPLKIRYLKRITDPLPPLFGDALSWRLAADLADELTSSNAKAQWAEMGFTRAMATARRMNAIERPTEASADDSWIMGRR